MGDIIKRKDNTSIFCPKLNTTYNFSKQKIRFVEIIMTFILLTLGSWIIILAK